MRDPRQSPKPGDVLRDKKQERRVVKINIYGWVIWTNEDIQPFKARAYPKQWQKWAANAEVIHAAD